MTNEVKNVPEVRFPEFSGEWKEKQLGDVTKTNQGLQIAISDRKTEYKKGLYFYITNEFLRPNSNTKYYIENPPESVIAEKNDILMTRTGNTGKVITNVEGAFHNNFFKIKYNKSIIDRLFLFELLKSPKINNKFLSLAGTSTIPDLNHSDFYSVYISFPTILEQQKIGSFFSKLDRQIELEEQKLAKLEEQKKGYMQKIFSQELRFKDENGSEYQRWTEGTIKSLVHGNISDGDWIEKEHISKNGKYRIIQTGNIGIGKYLNKEKNSKFINQKDYDELKANEIYSGDILISRLAEPAGRSIIMPKINWPMVTSVDVAIIRPNNLFDPYFLISMLNTDKKLYDISKFVSGSSHKRISRKNLEKIKVICPEIREQQKIGNFFRKIDKIIEKQSNKIELLKERKQGFLQKMFV